MAFRNIHIHKQSAVLTIAAAMIGTALITASLLLHSAMTNSVERYFTQHFGRIASDLPAANQEKLAGRTYFLPEDIAEIERLSPEPYGPNSIPVRDKILPIAGLETVLIKPEPAGRPLLLNPNTYVYGFNYSAAREFDPGFNLLLKDLKADEIVLTAPVAERLKIKTGDTVTTNKRMPPGNNFHNVLCLSAAKGMVIKMIITRKIRLTLWVVGYCLLTVIKLFTGVVGQLGDPTVSLVVKKIPTINNFWRMMGEETPANIAKYQGTGYFEKKYWVLTANESGFTGEFFYFLLIGCWWLITIGLILRVFRKRQLI